MMRAACGCRPAALKHPDSCSWWHRSLVSVHFFGGGGGGGVVDPSQSRDGAQRSGHAGQGGREARGLARGRACVVRACQRRTGAPAAAVCVMTRPLLRLSSCRSWHHGTCFDARPRAAQGSKRGAAGCTGGGRFDVAPPALACGVPACCTHQHMLGVALGMHMRHTWHTPHPAAPGDAGRWCGACSCPHSLACFWGQQGAAAGVGTRAVCGCTRAQGALSP